MLLLDVIWWTEPDQRPEKTEKTLGWTLFQLNQPSIVDHILQQIPQLLVLFALDLPPYTHEINKVTGQNESYKHETQMHCRHSKTSWNTLSPGVMPDDFLDALIVAHYKNKWSKSQYENYRTMSLLSIAGEIFAHILLNRLFGKESPRGAVWLLARMEYSRYICQVQKKCIEHNNFTTSSLTW